MATVAAGFEDDDADKERQILEILLSKGVISEEQLRQTLAVHREGSGDLGQIVVDLGFTSEDFVTMARAKAYGLQYLDFRNHAVSESSARLVPEDIVRRLGVLPIMVRDQQMFVAVSNPRDAQAALDEIGALAREHGVTPVPVLAVKRDLDVVIDAIFSADPAAGQPYFSPKDKKPASSPRPSRLDESASHYSLTGKTRVVAVWGHPVAHSQSPAMQNAAIRALGLDWVYTAFDVTPQNLEQAVAGLRSMGFVGANCTVPLKEAAGQYLDAVDPEAAAVGSVNTIVNNEGILTGYTTDGAGLIRDLRRLGIAELHGKRILIWGAGGSARSVAYALAQAGCSVDIANRTPARAEAVAKLAQGRALGLSGAEYDEAVASADILINTTTLGMNDNAMPPLPDGYPSANQTVYDVVYAPPVTPLLARARANGCRAAYNGLGMLACQGGLSLALWTGLPVDEIPLEIMLAQLR